MAIVERYCFQLVTLSFVVPLVSADLNNIYETYGHSARILIYCSH